MPVKAFPSLFYFAAERGTTFGALLLIVEYASLEQLDFLFNLPDREILAPDRLFHQPQIFNFNFASFVLAGG